MGAVKHDLAGDLSGRLNVDAFYYISH